MSNAGGNDFSELGDHAREVIAINARLEREYELFWYQRWARKFSSQRVHALFYLAMAWASFSLFMIQDSVIWAIVLFIMLFTIVVSLFQIQNRGRNIDKIRAQQLLDHRTKARIREETKFANRKPT